MMFTVPAQATMLIPTKSPPPRPVLPLPHTLQDANANISAWLKAHDMTSADLQQYFWQQMAVRVLPGLNKTIGVWEADALQINLTSLPRSSFVNVYQSLATANKTVSANKTTVVSLAGDWWYLDQLTCSTNGGYHQDGWTCAYDTEPQLPSWTPAQAALLKGGEAAMWGEGINKDNIDAYVWRGAAAIAERLWSPAASTLSHGAAAGRLAEHLCRLANLGVRAGPIGPNFCAADAAQPSPSTTKTTAQRTLAEEALDALVALDAAAAAAGVAFDEPRFGGGGGGGSDALLLAPATVQAVRAALRHAAEAAGGR